MRGAKPGPGDSEAKEGPDAEGEPNAPSELNLGKPSLKKRFNGDAPLGPLVRRISFLSASVLLFIPWLASETGSSTIWLTVTSGLSGRISLASGELRVGHWEAAGRGDRREPGVLNENENWLDVWEDVA